MEKKNLGSTVAGLIIIVTFPRPSRVLSPVGPIPCIQMEIPYESSMHEFRYIMDTKSHLLHYPVKT